MRLRALLRALDFFVPMDVLLAVFMVFALENIVDALVGDVGLHVWIVLYMVGVVMLGVAHYFSADEDERDEFEEDVDESFK